jgi:NAD(P)-dependent dehydrogenase (short-subunit alcohol dehydrogenase family)
MDFQLTGKTALVTGASRGIGLAIATALSAEGARVVAGASRGSAELSELAQTAPVHPVLVDLSEPGGPQELVSQTVGLLGGLDILVNNVGAVRPRLDGFLAITDEEWDWALTINFLAAVRTTRAALPHLLTRAPSAIVTVCSVNATLPDPSVIDYSSAKAALLNFSKSISKEFGPRGVRANTVSPGPVETALWLGTNGVAATVAKATGTDADSVKQQQAAAAVTGRFTRPDEVADLVVLLASNRVRNLTGEDLRIDGGLITTL